MHSDNTLLVTARAICRDWRIGPETVVSTLSPFSHNLGVGAMTTALVAGAELVIHDTPRGESLVDRLTETGVEYLIGVPTHAIDIIAELKRRGMKRLGQGARVPRLRRSKPAAHHARVDRVGRRAAVGLRHDREQLAPVHAAGRRSGADRGNLRAGVRGLRDPHFRSREPDRAIAAGARPASSLGAARA